MNIKRVFSLFFSTYIVVFTITYSYSQQKKLSEGEIVKGKASYYGDKYHGKKTASGEIYDNEKYTAAHPNLPFGSLIQVTNIANKKVVNLRVNDRGPYTGGRILDVSRKGAEYLEMYQDGVIDIELKVLRIGPGTVKPGGKGSILANNDTKKEEKNKEKKVDKTLKTDKGKTKKENTNLKKNTLSKTKNINSSKNKSLATTNKKQIKTAPKKNGKTKTIVQNNGKPVKVFKPKMTYNVWGTPKKPIGYGIQLGSYATQEKAQTIAKEAIKLDLKEVYIQTGWGNGKIVYRLLYGADENQNRLRKNIPKVISKGFSGVFIKKHFD